MRQTLTRPNQGCFAECQSFLEEFVPVRNIGDVLAPLHHVSASASGCMPLAQITYCEPPLRLDLSSIKVYLALGAMAFFPQEILDTIVSELEGDTASLKDCSMASWSLLLPARRSIFHHIRINQLAFNSQGEFRGSEHDHKRLLDLVKILENDPSLHPHREGTPTLSSCIRHLDLQLALTSSYISRHNPSAIMAAQKRWNATNTPLPDVLDRMSSDHIEQVTLHFHGMTCTWRLIDPSMASSILKLLRSPSIRTLDLSHIHGLPIDAVLHCPNLNDLRVKYVADQGSTAYTVFAEGFQFPIHPPSFVPSYSPPTPKYLTTTSGSSFLNALTKTPDNAVTFKNLHCLSCIDAWILSFDAALQVAETAAPNLQVLKISSKLNKRLDQSTLSNTPLGSLDLANLKQLRMMDVSFKEVMVLNQDPLSLYLPRDMLTLLRKTSAPTSIEVLHLTLAWEHITSKVENPIFSQPDWDSLDKLLNGPDYPALKEVAIVFQIRFDDYEDSEFVSLECSTTALSPILLALFPRLRCREGLNIQISITTNLLYSM